ncbi:MAG: hypothetical protein ACI4RA_06795 [Kiritimatiellia bacterium]
MAHQFSFVIVIALLGLAAYLATEKGRLPLALRGLKRTLQRDAGVPAREIKGEGVPLWRRLLACALIVAALVVAVLL